MRGFRAFQPVAVVGLLAILIFTACSDDPNEPAPEPGAVGSFVDHSGCLSNGKQDESPIPQDRGFLFWSYDSDTGTLRVDHVNAGLNCCPEYTAAITVTADALTITETETEGLCNCLCLFRLSFEVTDLPVGVYRIDVDEEYLAPEDPPLAGVIDLTQAEFGTIQAQRSHYPWDMGD
ncbi:MAG: hypothetical protein GY838_01030 [bacterium]|nr:hypothetical protein [bacterium]